MNYKAIIFDIDGTLIKRFDKKPTKKVTEAIEKAKKRINISIATGRPINMALDVIKDLNLNGIGIFNDGAQIINLQTKEILFEQKIEREDLFRSMEIMKKYRVSPFINENGKDLLFTNNYIYKNPLAIFCLNLDESIVENLFSDLSLLKTISIYKIDKWGEKDKPAIVVSHLKATKQHAILEYAKIMGIDTRKIIGVGDSYNDFPMFMACGLRIAMGNAVSELKEIADYIAPRVEEDGVVDVIEKYIL